MLALLSFINEPVTEGLMPCFPAPCRLWSDLSCALITNRLQVITKTVKRCLLIVFNWLSKLIALTLFQPLLPWLKRSLTIYNTLGLQPWVALFSGVLFQQYTQALKE